MAAPRTAARWRPTLDMLRARAAGDALPVGRCAQVAEWLRGLLPAPATAVPRCSEPLEALGRRLGRDTPLDHGRLLRPAFGPTPDWPGPAAGPLFVLRVDDYPRWDRATDRFQAFHEALGGLPYLLAVTPAPLRPGAESGSLTGAEIDRLHRAAEQGVTVGLHGLTHASPLRFRDSEFAGLPPDEQQRAIDHGLQRLRSWGFDSVRWFVPPFNTFDADTLAALALHDLSLCGGPESVFHVGRHPSPSALAGLLYLPSYPPAYGRAATVETFARELIQRSVRTLVPLTLHWAWEEESAFRDLGRLARTLAGRVIPFDRLRDE